MSHEEFPEIAAVDGVPEFNVLVLGGRTAGKTVFLSALYNQMRTVNNNRFLLRTNQDHHDLLQSKYVSIIAPGIDWPPGDLGVTEFLFEARRSGRSNEAMFRFRYPDFPGGAVLGDTRVKAFQLSAKVAEAHSIVVLVDGHGIRHNLDDPMSEESREFVVQFDQMCRLLGDCLKRPLTFVVTKYDLLRDVALERIVGLLREFESFSGLIKQRSEVNIPTRIIPVSALGNDFAKWDRERQVMEKPKVGTPKPINIDLTLAFALSDTILVHALRKIDPKDERRTWWLWAGGKTFSGAKEILRILKRLPLDIPYLPRTLSHLEQVAGETMEKLDERREALEAQINGAKTHNEAMELILAAQDAKKRVFLSKNPAADLIGR